MSPPLWQRLEEAIARPGGVDRAIATARALGPTVRTSGKGSVRLSEARAALRVAQDPDAPQEARQRAALGALLGLSCAVFWIAPPGACHTVAAAFDARMLRRMG